MGKRINAKAKGSRRERQAKKRLEKRGYSVIKSGGSLGALDLIGFRHYDIRGIQVKSNRKPPKAEMENLRKLKDRLPLGFKIEVWVYKDRVKEPEVICI